ncbi:MAG: hypothetical protein LBP40_06125 [Campylobacteraceae bacterium]|jgi:uncharacterized membrane protein|nr:hypothetical protein [Campylobacteraceae bacterium]
MRFLLINTNPAVSKLVNASLNRIGLETEEVGSYNNLPLDSFIAVIVDSDSYSPSHVDELLALSFAPSLIYLKQQNTPTPQGFQYALTKPFLPTDFISFIVSILKRTPELERFITPKAQEFVSMLPEEGKVEAVEETPLSPEEQALEGQFINFNFYDDLQKKEPIFGETAVEPIDSAFAPPKIEPDKTDDFSLNLSSDISQLYSQTEEQNSENTVQIPVSEPQKNEEIKISESKIEEMVKIPSSNDFVFNIDDSKSAAPEETVQSEQKSDTAVTIEEPKADILPQNETAKADEKIDFDFDIMDKIDEASVQEAFSPIDNFLKEPHESEEKPKKIEGFEELAKEFDDLIKPQNKSADTQKDTELPAYATEAKSEQSENDPFVNLNEKEMKRALQEGGLLPQSAEEMVKNEIQSVVQDSVQGLLQGNFLRDILKGLKMNITITFEDKE